MVYGQILQPLTWETLLHLTVGQSALSCATLQPGLFASANC